jgi:hypothetical protein
MLSFNGYILKRLQAVLLLILLVPLQKTDCQSGILDSTFTFSAGTVKTANALEIISRKTGYNFTYDTRLINAEKIISMNFSDLKLNLILDSILRNDSLSFSIIDKYIIISRSKRPETAQAQSVAAVESFYISGLIVDDESLEPLPFATIALKNNGKGTITNNNGEFGLKITTELVTDTLSISYLGYLGREIAVKQVVGNNFTISMKREFISIPEIIIRNQIPQEIIQRTLKAISHNYGDTPSLMTGFYREGVLRKDELQTYSEAVIQIYKSSYSGTLLSDQIKVYKSRKIENTNRNDTLAIRLKAGLGTCLDLDGAKNIFDFLSSQSMSDYSYRLTDIVTYDDESVYVIDFEPRENVDQPLYNGTLYINTTDYGIYQAQFELNPSLIHNIKKSFVSNASPRYNTWPISVKYSVSYRKMNNRYFLSRVRGDLIFSSSQKKKLFNTQFKVFFELAITDISLKNVTRFEREELAPIHSIFSKTITSYDPLFWANQDFIRPEENLLQALKNMKVKLQEFSK